MNNNNKFTKKGGFIKNLQYYQNEPVIIKNNSRQVKPDNTKFVKENSEFVKENSEFVKENSEFVKQNSKFVKQNTKFVKQNTKFVKQNRGFIKGDSEFVKTNREFVKTNREFVKPNREFVKPNSGFIKENSEFVKSNRGFIKGDSGFIKTNRGFIKGDSEFVKENSGFIKGDSEFVKGDGVGVKGDSGFIKGDSGFIKGDSGFIKGDGVGVKGDMDGLGKEKGNYSPRFVYLYKNKFEIEAVSNKYDMKGLSPLSGYEPKYNPNYWNNNKNIKNNNNCYSYSVNNKNHKFGKPQPGYFARFNHIQNNQYKCAYFFKRILNDIPSVYLTSFKQKCKKGFHKAFFAIDSNKNEHDYHFYRQDNNQLWSHKPGTTNVINYDAEYKIIQNPMKANRNYTAYNYDKPCFFFCVNNKFGKTKAQI